VSSASGTRWGSTAAAVLLASRPVSWINTAYPFAAAYLLTGTVRWWVLVVATFYFLVPYNLLMYGINDVFDHESDLRNPRKGGIQGAMLDRSVHRATLVVAVVSNVPFLVVLFAVGSTTSNLALAVTVAAVLAYSVPVLRFKERPVLDSATSATHFVGPAVVGVLLDGTDTGWGVVAALAAFFCWGMASHALGAVQDIAADRQAGIGSIAARFGARWTLRAVFAAYLAAAALLLTAGWPGMLAAVLVVPYLVNVWSVRTVTDATCTLATAAWRRFLWLNQIAGFGVTMLLIWIHLHH